MGQRKVAEATRKKFGLSKFSHSTVCRTFNALGESFAYAAKGASVHESSNLTSAVQPVCNSGARSGGSMEKTRRVPSAADTSARRTAMAAFLRDIIGSTDIGDITVASRKIVKIWHDKHRRLLI